MYSGSTLINEHNLSNQKRNRDEFASPKLSGGALKPITPLYNYSPHMPNYFIFQNNNNNNSNNPVIQINNKCYNLF